MTSLYRARANNGCNGAAADDSAPRPQLACHGAAPSDPGAAPPPVTATVAVHLARLLTEYCSQQGLDPAGLFREVGMDVAAIDEDDARLPFTAFALMCDLAAERLGDPCLGLHLGQAIQPGHFGSYGFSLVSCRTVREQLQRCRRFSTLVYDVCRNEFEEHDDYMIRYWRSQLPGGASPGRLQDELGMATWVVLAQWMLAREVRMLWVSFRHPQPPEIDDYEALFDCPLRFSADETACAFDKRYFDIELPQADNAVRDAMDALCERRLQRLEANDPDWLAACRREIAAAFDDGEPSLDAIAAVLELSPRALRHRLSQRGESFRGLVEGLRQDLAQTYLENPALSLVDIAFLLGFSDQSAFQRSFKRWAGTTPGRYRQAAIAD